VGFYENSKEFSVSVKGEEFVDKLSDYLLLNNDCSIAGTPAAHVKF
jgi:hypothetical protein